MNAKKPASVKKPAKRESRSKKATKKPALVITAREVRRMMRSQALEIKELRFAVSEIRVESHATRSWLDRCVGPMIHRLSLLGDWNLIKPEDGQRLMNAAGGEMTPVYVEWYLATYGVEATREKYSGRLNALPPYLRAKL